jgi:hypothetical protein
VCQVTDDSSVERTLDSGRYFVLRITNQQGRHAFIGIAFNERNDAFDFNVALNEFKSELERETKATEWSTAAPAQDFSLKSGEKIKIKLVWTMFCWCQRSLLKICNLQTKKTHQETQDNAPTFTPTAAVNPSTHPTAKFVYTSVFLY